MCCTRCEVKRFIKRQVWTVEHLCQEIGAPEHEANVAKWLAGKAQLDDVALAGRMRELMQRLEPPPHP